MQMPLRCVVLAALIGAVPSAASAGELKFTLLDGRATIVASDVSLRQILDEWARVGHTTVVNADKLISTPVTLQLVDVPEAQALETLLRTASGYVVAERASYTPGALAVRPHPDHAGKHATRDVGQQRTPGVWPARAADAAADGRG